MMPRLTFTRKNLWFWRLSELLLLKRSVPKDAHIENISLPAQDGHPHLRLRLYHPNASPSLKPALLWMHGGGYIIGKPEQDDGVCLQYVRELGLLVASVDYRRAPEHPFPAPLDDAYMALHWIATHAGQLGVDAARLAVGGASAGAGLAAALAQLACDRNEIKPILQLLAYPMLDDRTAIRPDALKLPYLIWNQASNRFGWESYLGQACGAADAPPYAVPAHRADLSSLPPAWIGIGTLDLFHAENLAYAQRLKECGVACELVTVPGAFHGFDTIAPNTQVAQDFRSSQIAALKRRLFPDPPALKTFP